MISENTPYAPHRLGRDAPVYTSPPAIISPIKLSLGRLVELADTDAGRLLTSWLKNHPGGGPKDHDTQAWGETRYAQGYADGLRAAQERTGEVVAALEVDLNHAETGVEESTARIATTDNKAHQREIVTYNEGWRDSLSRVIDLTKRGLS